MKCSVTHPARIVLGVLICVLSAMPVVAQSTSTAYLSNGAQIISVVSGEIVDKPPGVMSMGTGGATLYDASGRIVADRSGAIYFRDPVQTKMSWWGNEVRATSIGNRTLLNNRGVYSEQTSSPFVYGDGKYTSAGGNLLARLGSELAGTSAGEVRFQALEVIGILNDLSNSSGSTTLRSGRDAFFAGLMWVPPPAVSEWTATNYTANLVVELRYGMDGVVEGGPDIGLKASRAMDLEILGGDGVTMVNIRKIAGNPAPPMLSGWTEIEGNTAYLTTASKLTGLRTSEVITWGNGAVTIPPGRTIVNTWKSKIIRVPILLSSRSASSFKITAMSSNSSLAYRNKSPGRFSIPASLQEAPSNPRWGSGIEVRARLEIVAPQSGGTIMVVK